MVDCRIRPGNGYGRYGRPELLRSKQGVHDLDSEFREEKDRTDGHSERFFIIQPRWRLFAVSVCLMRTMWISLDVRYSGNGFPRD